jgi:hypothetical protein
MFPTPKKIPCCNSVIEGGNWSNDRLKVLLEFLKEKWVDINSRNHDGQMLLYLVSDSKDQDTECIFITAGADIEARDYKGRTWWLHVVIEGTVDETEL